MVLGAITVGLFFIYVAYRIVDDEMKRTKFYTEKVDRYKAKLTDKYQISTLEIKEFCDEFEAKDVGEGRKKEEEE